jgi:CHAT domain-containing protein
VEVLWKNRWWPATLERLQGDRYCITYDGFDHSWDECITSDRIRPIQTTPEATAKRLYQVGFQNLLRRQYVAAITDLEKSLHLAQVNHLNSVESLVVQERALNALSVAYVIVGDFDKLQKTAEIHLKVAEQLQDSSAATIALTRLGSAYFYRGDFAKAASFQQQAIERAASGAPATQKLAIAALAETYLAQGKAPLAIALLRQLAPSEADPELQLTVLQGLGIAYTMQEQYPQAIDVLQQAIQLAERNQGLFDISQVGNAVNNLGYALYRSGNLPQAETQLRRALKLWETQRSPIDPTQLLKVSLLESQLLSYNTLQKVLVQQHQPEAALEVSEQGRARVFLELVAERISPEAAQRLGTDAMTLDRIRAVAKAQRATLVEYSLIDTRPQFSIPGRVEATELFIWVVKPTGEVVLRSIDLQTRKPSIENLVFEAREAIRVDNHPNSPDKLKQLYDLLIAPVADLLPADPNANVIFIPQRSLFLVPFAALQNAQGKYLIEQYTIVTAPSIQMLESTQRLRQRVEQVGRQQALVVGNPKMPLQLSQLPGAQREAEAIATLFHTQPILGAQATKAAIVRQMPNARWIHLATHGILDNQQGLGSAIALAPNGTGETNDGLLTADEILNLKLNAELVVLSACDTGQGRITGDGVLGLSRSLITAGVPSVIVSLWAVNDASTSQLMRQFYTNLSTGKMGKAEALRQAQISLIMGKQQTQSPGDRSSVNFQVGQGVGNGAISHDLSHPYYWAPFILIGNGL